MSIQANEGVERKMKEVILILVHIIGLTVSKHVTLWTELSSFRSKETVELIKYN